jgi:hypothetical protein
LGSAPECHWTSLRLPSLKLRRKRVALFSFTANPSTSNPVFLSFSGKTNMKDKQFKKLPHEIIQLVEPMGACMATDMITVEGFKVGYMYRDEPFDKIDSGWRFFSGTESQEYVDDPDNSALYDVNTIANYDKDIVPYLELPAGSELERIEGSDRFNFISS